MTERVNEEPPFDTVNRNRLPGQRGPVEVPDFELSWVTHTGLGKICLGVGNPDRNGGVESGTMRSVIDDFSDGLEIVGQSGWVGHFTDGDGAILLERSGISRVGGRRS